MDLTHPNHLFKKREGVSPLFLKRRLGGVKCSIIDPSGNSGYTMNTK